MWNVKRRKKEHWIRLFCGGERHSTLFTIYFSDIYLCVCVWVCRSQSLNVRWSKSTKTEQRSKTMLFSHSYISILIQFNSSAWHLLLKLKIKTDDFLIAHCRPLGNARVFRLMSLIREFLYSFPTSSSVSICGRHFVFALHFTHISIWSHL